MTKELEEQYLKELKRTEKNLLAKGKIYAAGNLQKLILDCEKRIEEHSKKPQAVLVGQTIWKALKGWEKTHLISNSGIIKKKGYKSVNSMGITRYIPGSEVSLQEFKNYLRVVLTDSERTKRFAVSNLVYENFIGEVPPGYMARPKDDNIYNCNDYNLYLGKIDNTVNKYKKVKKKVA